MKKTAQEVTLTIGGAEVTIRAGATPIPSHEYSNDCSSCDTPVDHYGRPLPPGSPCKLREFLFHDDDGIACNAVWDCPQALRQREAQGAEDATRAPEFVSDDPFGDGDTPVCRVGTKAFDELPAYEQKRLILEKYAGKDPKQFIQYDVGGGEMYAGMTTDLMQTLGLRVLIEPGMPKEAVLEGLEHIAELIRRSGLFEPMGVDKLDRLRKEWANEADPQGAEDAAPVRDDDDPPAIGSQAFRDLPTDEQKRRILQDYSERGVVELLEVHSGFLRQELDAPSQVPDADGDYGESWMETLVRLPYRGALCVYIRPGVTKAAAVRLLRKTASSIELHGLMRAWGQE